MLAAVIGQTKLLPPEKMKHSIKLVDEQMNWCDSAMEVRGLFLHCLSCEWVRVYYFLKLIMKSFMFVYFH